MFAKGARMIVETGHYALVLALALALVNSVLPVWGSIGRDQRLMAVRFHFPSMP